MGCQLGRRMSKVLVRTKPGPGRLLNQGVEIVAVCNCLWKLF
jgi:hypothetical protein